MAQLSPVFNDAQLDGNGNPLVGGRLFTWLVGSMTKATVFADSFSSSNHTNPIILNARGEPPSPIYLPAATTLRFGLAPANDTGDPPTTLIRDIDGVNDYSTSALTEWSASGLTPTFLTSTTFTVPTDATVTLHVGRRIRSQNTSGTVFSTIVSSVFTTLTTITVVNDTTIGLDAGLSSFSSGIISAVNTSWPSALLSEWVPSVLTPTFLTSTTLTVPGNQSSILHSGRRIRSTNTSGTVFSTIVTSVFTTLTTITVVNDSTVGLDSGLRSFDIGGISAINTSWPQLARKKNLIWNGSMDCWQDGTSEAAITASSNRMADGYLFSAITQGTWTVDRVTTVPTVAQAGRNLNFALRALVTTADGAPAAGDLAILQYTVEGFDYQELFSQPQHLSFWVRSTTVGIYCVAFRNSANDRSFVFEYQINAANTFEFKQFSLTEIPIGGGFNFQGGVGISIAFTLASGATFQTTPNGWRTGNFIATSAQTNLAATINNDFIITDIQLTAGAAASPIIVLDFSEILLKAERRFSKTFGYAVKPAQAVLSFLGALSHTTETTTVGDTSFWQYILKRAIPVITTYNPTQANANWRNIGNTVDSAVTVLAFTGESSATISTASGTINTWGIHVTADARF